MHTGKFVLSLTLAAGLCALPGMAQQTDQQAPPPPPDQQPYPQATPPAQPTTPPPNSGWHKFGESQTDAPPAGTDQSNPPNFQGPPAPPMPTQLTLPTGTWITIRINQVLSSDHNQPGDAFTGTLAQPLMTQGRIVSRPGQTVGGRVTEVEKHHSATGHSKLGLEVTEIQLADGQQVPVKTSLVQRQGGTHAGSNAATIGATTGVGAAIGAAVNGGVGRWCWRGRRTHRFHDRRTCLGRASGCSVSRNGTHVPA